MLTALVKSGLQTEQIGEELAKVLPHDEGKTHEKPAEAALRKRMCAFISPLPLPLNIYLCV